MNNGSPALIGIRNAFDDEAGVAANLPFINAYDYNVRLGADGITTRAALQTLIDNMGSAPGLIRLPQPAIGAAAAQQVLNLTGGVVISNDRQVIEGSGPYASGIQFTPAAGAGEKAISFARAGAGVLYQCGLKNLSLSSPETAVVKIAVRLKDVSGFLMDRVTTGPNGQWTGGGSIGIQMEGRETSSIRNFNFSADRPILIKHNANVGGATLDFDVNLLQHGELYAYPGYYCIEVEDGAQIGRSVFDHIDFISGSGGFHWKDTNAAPAGQVSDILFSNIYSEGLAAAGHPDGAWIIYLNTIRGLRGLTCFKVNGGAGAAWNGFYFRGAYPIDLMKCDYTGGAGAVFWDADSAYLDIDHSFCQVGAVINAANMECGKGEIAQDSGTPTWYSEKWFPTNAGNARFGLVEKLGDNYRYGKKVTLAAGAQVAVGDRSGAAAAGEIRVKAKGATVDVDGAAAFFSDATPTRLYGTANFDVTGAGGTLSFQGSAGSRQLNNQTAESLIIGYVVEMI